MALSKLSGDEQGIILGQLRDPLEPRLVMYFSSASKELRALLTPAARQQLRADYEAATALCVKMGMRNCKKLREATRVRWVGKGLTAADLATLAKLGSVLPALKMLTLYERSRSAGPDGVREPSRSAGPDGVLRLAEGLVVGALPVVRHLDIIGMHVGEAGASALPVVRHLDIIGMHVGEAGASALAAALDRGALPRLEVLVLTIAAIGDAGLAALAPALRRRPALRKLGLSGNPLGDEGLAALVAPPPPAADTPPRPAGGLKKLKWLDLSFTQVSDAGCATLVAALHSGALPALDTLHLDDIPASGAARRRAASEIWFLRRSRLLRRLRRAVSEALALARSRARA